MHHRELIVNISSKARYVGHVVRDPGDRAETVLRDFVDLLHVGDVLEETRVFHGRQRQRRQTIVVTNTQQLFEQAHLYAHNLAYIDHQITYYFAIYELAFFSHYYLPA